MGIYFYQSRFYDPWLERFLQADTIVPEPLNSGSWDRYAYVVNNPTNFIDPSGHYYCEDDSGCNHNQYHRYSGDELLQEIFDEYGISFKGKWSHRHKRAVALAITAVGLACNSGNSAACFQLVYDITTEKPMVFEWGNCPECNGGGAYTANSHLIKFASLSAISELRRVNNIVHELGHAFNAAITNALSSDESPYYLLWLKLKNDPFFPRREKPPSYYGFFSISSDQTWQQNNSNSPNEEFADMFLGWVFNRWQMDGEEVARHGRVRSEWMMYNMFYWGMRLGPMY